MLPHVKLIVITLLVGIFEVAMFYFLGKLLLFQLFAGTFGSAPFESEMLNDAAALLNVGALLLCPLMCPLVAFYFRSNILDATTNTNVQFIIFVIISTFPIVLAGIVIFLAKVFSWNL